MSRLIILFFFILTSLAATAQPVLDKLVSFSVTDQSIEETLYQFGKAADIMLTFSNDIIPQRKINYSFSNATIRQVLTAILKDTELSYQVIGGQIVIYKKEQPKPQYTVSGYVEDLETGEVLVGATIMVNKINAGTSSNGYGFFSLELEEGTYVLSISYLGYQSNQEQITLTKNKRIKIAMRPSLTLKEIIVVAENLPIFDPDDYIDKLVSAQLSAMPTLGGEKDLFRLATQLPGVTTGTDGVGGIHVRGGSIDQNLFLLDDVPIYNPTHLLGAFSVFNNDAIKSASFVRGRFPARYGGRLSSVMDIRTKDGNLNKWETSIGVGLASVKISTEGPLIKGKSSFILAARTTPLGLLIKEATRDNKTRKNQEGETDLSFYDINAKLHYKFSDRNKLYLSFYNGSDRYEDDTAINYTLTSANGEASLFNRDRSVDNIRWGNTAGAIRWNHLIGNKVFLNTSLIFSRYNFESKSASTHTDTLSTDQSILNINRFILFSTVINDVGLKMDFDHTVSKSYKLRYGGEATIHRFTPGVASETGNISLTGDDLLIEQSFFDSIDNPTIPATEFALYTEHNLSWKKLDLRMGLRWSGFAVEGKLYQSFQPRFDLSWRPWRRLQINTGFSYNQQYLHLLGTSGVGLPTDIWIPSTPQIQPEEARQIVFGFKSLLPSNFEFGIEAYYKKMDHLVEYTENASFTFINSRNFENNIVTGAGTSRGLEFLLEKKLGRTTALLSYTLSKTDRTFDDINNGNPFPYRYDRRHNLKFTGSHRVSERWTFVTNFVYGSGLAVSLPSGTYTFTNPSIFQQSLEVLVFSERNGFRLPANHRWDIALNWRKIGKNTEQNAGIGVYNLYNRKNTLYYRLGRNPDNPSEPAFLRATLVPILPYINYTIKF